MCLKAICSKIWYDFQQEIQRLTFLKRLKTSDFLSFALIIGNDESQSKAPFVLQSVGDNKTDGCRQGRP